MQFAFLKALDLQLIRSVGVLEGRDRGIEIAMLLKEARQLRAELAFFLLGHVPQQFETPPGASQTTPKPQQVSRVRGKASRPRR